MIINMNGAKAPETPSPVLQEKTVTPETLPTVIGADEGYDGLSQVTVNPDSQLKAENIRSGKTIFGVEGVFAGEKQVDPTAVWEAEQMPLRMSPAHWSSDISGMSWSASSKKPNELPGRPIVPDANYMVMSGNVLWLNQFITYTNNYPNMFETQAPEYHFSNTLNIVIPYDIIKNKSYSLKLKCKLIRVYRDTRSGGFSGGEITSEDTYDFVYEKTGVIQDVIVSIPIDYTFPAKTVYSSFYTSNPPTIKYVSIFAFIERIMIEVTE